MGKVVHLSSYIKERKSEITSQNIMTGTVPEHADCGGSPLGKGHIIPVDFSKAQLQLLRIKGKKLEEAKLVLYKGDINIDIPITSNIDSVDARVLVKKQRLEYYFYCPRCGTKVCGAIEIGSTSSSDSPGLSWDDIQEMVRAHIVKRTEEGDYPRCTERSAEQ